MRRKVLSLLALTIVSATVYAQTPQARIDRLFAKWDKDNSPGCAVAVVKDGEIVFKNTYGMADIDTKTRIDEHTLFDAGTLSRHFTAAAVVSLIVNGAGRPTDSIRVTIPEMPPLEPMITIQDLFNHTSGVPDYISVWKKARRPEIPDALAMVDLLAEAKPRFPAGSRFEVSASDYFLLGFVAQRVTSFTLAEWAQNMVFKPAGMTHSVFSDHPDGLPPARARGYRKKPLGGYAEALNPLPDICGDTGLWTTIEDLAQWEKTVMEKQAFAPKFFELLETAPKCVELPENAPKSQELPQINNVCGLTVQEYRGFRVLSHSGRANGFSTALLRIPGKNLAVIYLSNLASLSTESLLRQVASLYF